MGLHFCYRSDNSLTVQKKFEQSVSENLLELAIGTTMFEKGAVMPQSAGSVVSGWPKVVDVICSKVKSK
jgi:hypothetical protein